MVNFENSYLFGADQEKKVLPIVNEYFDRDIQPFKNRYSKYDFFDDEYVYELKSRCNCKNKFPTTMITMNKLVDDKKLILLFNFEDCLTYIEYDKSKFAKYKTQQFSRAQIEEDMKEHIYIDINDLIEIKEYK
jgi:hypothetical protein